MHLPEGIRAGQNVRLGGPDSLGMVSTVVVGMG